MRLSRPSGPESFSGRLRGAAFPLLAAALLAAAALGVGPEASGAQDGMSATAARHEVRAAAEAERRRQARAERHRRLEQARAHVRMPSTLYASTPDPALPPHPAHSRALDVSAKRALAVGRIWAKSTARQGHRVAFFPSASRWAQGGYQGFARLINRTGEAGEVRIEAFDDAGVRHGPATLRIGANASVQFNSADLESGNAGLGLSGGIGSGTGDWRLRVSSALELQVLSYIRTREGFLTSMHDLVPESEGGHRAVIFNPGRNRSLVSRLRVVNPGAQRAAVRIEGIDARGASSADAVTFSLAAGASRMLSAQQLESGEGAGLSGALGTGKGKWQLVVSAEAPIEVMSLLSTRSGHLTNLSTAPAHTESAEDRASVFREHISGPVVQSKCVACHVEGGVSGNTRLVFVPASEAGHEATNLRVFEDFFDEVDDGATYVLNKVQGVAHGGGVQVAAGTPEFTHLKRFLRLLGEEVTATPLTPQTLFDKVRMAPWRKTLRRAALIFAGRNPTEAEYAAVAGGDAGALSATIRGLMTGPEFHEFLTRGANDRLLTDRSQGASIIDEFALHFVDFTNENYRRAAAARASGTPRDIDDYWKWYRIVQYGARRAPLELIAHIVENDRPYTEILTADYVMANRWAAEAYGAPTHHFDDPEDVHEFKPSEIVSYYRTGDGFVSEYDSANVGIRIVDPGPLLTDYPHAGILNTTVFLKRYPTTATNRNRARSRWTYYHFLGLDIEKSASRTTDPVALADTNNPTMHNPACTVCHRVLDPVAGTFQNYGDEGLYRDQWGGLDSLDGHYKDGWARARETFEITAESRAEQQTVSVRAWLPAGAQMVRIDPYFNPPRLDGSEIWWNMGIEHVTVRDGDGVAVNRLELETVADELDLCGRYGPSYDGMTGDPFYEVYFCTQRVQVEIPADGEYDIEVVVWVVYQHDDVADQRRMLDLSVDGYQGGDTWYRDMRTPGFAGEQAPNPDNSVQWLARKIVADERFAEATVKFWWPAIMGREVAEPPEDEGDADFEGRLLAANAQGAEVTRLANGFRRGFRGGRKYNLKDLLVELVLSKWFRADSVESANPILHVALRDAGARRLLTPEELSRKTAAVTGVEWRRTINANCWPRCERRLSALTDEYRLLYGGIDSDGVTERARDLTSVMAAVARTHATQMSCPIIMREFYLLPDAERRLFSGIDKNVTPSRGADIIRNKLVELHDQLLGVQVTPHSPDVESAYQLFIEVWERKRASRDADTDFLAVPCDWWRDSSFYEGIADDVLNHEYDFDWDRVNDFMDGIDWSDNHYVARTWIVVLAYLMMDYRYLYL